MEYRKQSFSPALTSAVALFEKLNEGAVRYGIFKSSRNTLLALAGDQDLDILVAREDYGRFCAIASHCGGIRSTNHQSLMSPGREDWFVPNFEHTKYLHLDVHVNVRLGAKFNKRYPFFSYGDVRHWDRVRFGGCRIPIASPQDEAGITLSRIAFRSRGTISGSWHRLSGDWALEIGELLFAATEMGEKSARIECAGLRLQCRIRRGDDGIWVHREDLANIRRLVRTHCGAAPYSAFTDALTNSLRVWSYALSRLMNRLWPGSTMDRRRPAGGGLIVAVVAPDGMGKTTQVERMRKLFGWKFCCTSLYLGTGDGRGWWIRRLLRALYMKRRSKLRATFLDGPGTQTSSANLKSRVGSILLGLWGVLTALERLARVRTARRMADRGFIVICDRWPQAIQPGLMDGPTQQRSDAPANWLRRWELSLYDRMTRIQPDLAVQLTGDYALSAARKPGELTCEDFDKRISLMKAIRTKTPRVHVIDASRDVDEVSRSLFALIWNAL